MGETAVRVYSYGCPYWADPGEEVMGQLRLANRLWNALVEIQHGHEGAKAAIWVSDPAVAAAQRQVDGVQEALAAVREHMLAARKRDRSTIPRPENEIRLEQARQAVGQAKTVLDAARKAARLVLRPAFAAALKDRTEAVKATYAVFVQEQGLGWGTYNDVVRRRFPAAVAKVEERRKAGLPAQLRFRRFDGTGTLTVQVQHQAGAPPRTVPALNSGAHPKSAALSLTPWRDPDAGRPKGDARHGTLRLTAGRSRAHGPLVLDLPVVLDRYLSADADIAEVKVSRRAVGSHQRWSVAMVCKEAAPAAPQRGAVVAVRLSWASAGDGWLRVAHIGSTGPLPPLPDGLASVVKAAADGMSAQVFYSAAWRHLLERDDGIRSVRDRNLDVVREQVCAALKAGAELRETLGVTAGDVARWRSAARFVRLARSWPADHPLAAALEAWRARDRHLWDYESHERAQVLAARRDAYRKVAAWLCAGAREVTVDGLDLAAVKQAPGVGREDGERARHGRAQMHDAAPGELREAIMSAAAKRGIPVTVVRKRKESVA